eukprot:GILJ01003509.1.p1 GENE.GILJ01003509.1~~GILJ01003509.1.p1  ORF type:complete len:186 (+),score=9.23 GILJ01003509.1:223-780(+)
MPSWSSGRSLPADTFSAEQHSSCRKHNHKHHETNSFHLNLAFDTSTLRIRSTSFDDSDVEKECYICYEGDHPIKGPIILPCKCPRYVHKVCLNEWRRRNQGFRRNNCQFCYKRYYYLPWLTEHEQRKATSFHIWLLSSFALVFMLFVWAIAFLLRVRHDAKTILESSHPPMPPAVEAVLGAIPVR